jgi:tRNA(Ile2) C34 agmatinyltransferase TiaS
MIRASCHTADNALALEFDATPWFREADPQSILHLAAQGWSSVWVADALGTRPGYEGLHQLVEYAATRLRDESLEDPTWAALDCAVNPSDAKQWLAENRLEIASMLQRGRPAP